MKNLIIIKVVLLFILSIPFFSLTASANSYAGGVIDGKTFTIGSFVSGVTWTPSTSTTSAVTDNNTATYVTMMSYNQTNLNAMQIFLDQPVVLSKYKLLSESNINIRFFFNDGTGRTINNAINTGALTDLDVTLFSKPVTSIIVHNTASGADKKVYEFNVYTEGQLDSTAPSTPINLTGTLNSPDVVLNWTANTEPDIAAYKVYQNGQYIATVTTTTYKVAGLSYGNTYTFEVTAIDQSGNESGKSNSVQITIPPIQTVTNRALLVITLVNGLEKEYHLSMTEVDAFISWYNNRAQGVGPDLYSFNKTYNLANFTTRKDYISFSKIEMFEVNEYKAE